MGNRAVVIFYARDGVDNEYSPLTYLHWHGSIVPELISKCAKLMTGRRTDLSYVAARFVGICHADTEGNLSLGIGNVDGSKIIELSDLTRYCPGDAGVFAVNVTTSDWEVTRLSGSHYECEAPSKWTVS